MNISFFLEPTPSSYVFHGSRKKPAKLFSQYHEKIVPAFNKRHLLGSRVLFHWTLAISFLFLNLRPQISLVSHSSQDDTLNSKLQQTSACGDFVDHCLFSQNLMRHWECPQNLCHPSLPAVPPVTLCSYPLVIDFPWLPLLTLC